MKSISSINVLKKILLDQGLSNETKKAVKAEVKRLVTQTKGWEKDFSHRREPNVGDVCPLFSENLY